MEFGNAICVIDISEDKIRSIRHVIDNCSIFRQLDDIEHFKKAVEKREKIETTGIGHGIAIAHGKIMDVPRVMVGLGLSRDGVDYDAKDGEPVNLLFVIASSPALQLDYIKTLSAILRGVRNIDVRNALVRLAEDGIVPEACREFVDMLENQDFLAQ